jgi:hypothetical protein
LLRRGDFAQLRIAGFNQFPPQRPQTPSLRFKKRNPRPVNDLQMAKTPVERKSPNDHKSPPANQFHHGKGAETGGWSCADAYPYIGILLGTSFE